MVMSGAVARSTLSASATTSGPMPSPPTTASRIVREPMSRTLLGGRACRGPMRCGYRGGCRVAAVVAAVQRDLHRGPSAFGGLRGGSGGTGGPVPGIHVVHGRSPDREPVRTYGQRQTPAAGGRPAPDQVLQVSAAARYEYEVPHSACYVTRTGADPNIPQDVCLSIRDTTLRS